MERIVRHGQLGFIVQPVTSDIARNLGLSPIRGVLVNEVPPDSPAVEAGVNRGDVIVGFNGEPIEEGNELRNRVAATPSGSEVTLTVFRDGIESNCARSSGN